MEDLYAESRRIYLGKNYEGAITSFRRLIEKFPDHQLTSNSHYWMAASRFNIGEYEQALSGYDTVINQFSKSFKVPDAYLRKGHTLLELHRGKEAVDTFNRLIKLFPKTEAAGKAKKTLEKLKINGEH